MPSKETIPWDGTGKQSRIASYQETDKDTVNFHARKARGEDLPVNDYDWFNIVHVMSPALRYGVMRNIYQTSYGGVHRPTSILNGASAPAPGNPLYTVGEWDRQVTRFRNSLFDKVLATQMSIVPFMKELPELCRSIAGLARTAISGYDALRRGQPSRVLDVLLHGAGATYADAKRIVPGVASRWLEWSYGLKPAMQDAQNGLQRLHQALVPPDREVSVDIRYSVYPSSSSTYTGSGAVRSHVHKARVSYKSECVYRIDSPWDSFYQGLGLDNVLGGLWECIPFSFVVDWVVDVSGWLSSGRSIEGASLVRSWESFKLVDYSIITDKLSGQSTLTGQIRRLEKIRRKLTTMPSRGFAGFWNPSWSTNRSANAAALMVSQREKYRAENERIRREEEVRRRRTPKRPR